MKKLREFSHVVILGRGRLMLAAAAAAALMGGAAHAATPVWQGGTSTDWFDPTNWSTGAVPTGVDTATFANPTPGNLPDLGAGSARVLGLTLDNTGGPYTISGTNALSLAGGGVAVNGGGAAVVTPLLLPVTAGTWTVAPDTTLRLSGGLSGIVPVTMGGGGTLEVNYSTGAYAGGFVVNAGTLSLAQGTTQSALHSNTVTLGGTATLSGSNAGSTTLYSGALKGAGTVDATGKRFVMSLTEDGASSAAITAGTPTQSFSTQGIGTQTLTGTLNLTGGLSIGPSSNIVLAGNAVFLPQGITNYTGNTAAGPSVNTSGLIKGGTLVLDNSVVNNNDRVQGEGYLEIAGGGGVTLIGNAAGTSEDFGKMPIAPFAGAGNVKIVHNAGAAAATVLTLPGVGQINTTATLDFSANVPLGSAANGPHVMLAQSTGYAFQTGFGANQSIILNKTLGVDGTNGFPQTTGMFTVNNRNDFAGYDANLGIVPVAYDAFPTTAGGTAGANALLTTSANTATTGGGANFALNTLKIAPTADGQTLDINGTGDLQVSGYILSGPRTFTITSSGGGKIGGRHTRYFHVADPMGLLVLNADLGGPGPTGTSGVVQNNPMTKDGPGTLALGAVTNFTNTASVNINILDGALRVRVPGSTAGAATLPDNTTVRFRGGVLEIEGGGTFNRALGTGAQRVTWGSVASESGSGGFAAFGGSARVDLNALDTRDEIKWRMGAFAFEDQALIFGSRRADSTIEWFDHLNLSDATSTSDNFASIREVRVIDNPDSTTDKAVISGEVRSNTADKGGMNADFLKTGDGILELAAAANSYLGNTIVAAGTLRVTGSLASGNYILKGGTFRPEGGVPTTSNVLLKGGAVTFSSARTTVSSVAGGAGRATVETSATPNAKVLVVKSLALTGGTLDLQNNGMVVDYEKGEASPILKVRDALKSGFAGGSWTGTGIVTGAPGNASTGIGYGEASSIAAADRTHFFPGDAIDIDDSAVLLRYTKRGDATLDGSVDFNDLVKLAQNYNVTSGDRVWGQGDFNYDGSVDFNDLVLLAQNYNTALGTDVPGASAAFEADAARAFAAVPEPGGVAMIAVAAGMMGRRRRNSVR